MSNTTNIDIFFIYNVDKMPKCTESICNKNAYFNAIGQTKGLYCSSHKLEGMVNVVDKLCESCDKRAIYNHPGHTKGKYCMAHQNTGMINVKLKRCAELGCYTTPIYNVVGSSTAKYCSEHKEDSMVNVVSKRCHQDECERIAQFNLEGEKTGKYCSIHKLENMIDIKHKRCEHPGCPKMPSYKYLEDTQPRFCAEHKTDEMIDGKHMRCEYVGCSIAPTFNEPGYTRPKMCSTHKTETMIDVFHTKCIFDECNLRAVYNFKNIKSAKYCINHKDNGMIDVFSKVCLSEWCSTKVSNKYDEYCFFCYINLFPDKPITRNYKTKEKTIVDSVIETFPQMTWYSDKKIVDGCSKKRPDLLLDLGNQVIIVEIDENQHNAYDCSCENKRLMMLSQDLGHRPIVFIRFNPDDYIDKTGVKISSCWKLQKTGILAINRLKTKEWANRLEVLKNQINYWLTNNTAKTVEIVHLYYDGME